MRTGEGYEWAPSDHPHSAVEEGLRTSRCGITQRWLQVKVTRARCCFSTLGFSEGSISVVSRISPLFPFPLPSTARHKSSVSQGHLLTSGPSVDGLAARGLTGTEPRPKFRFAGAARTPTAFMGCAPSSVEEDTESQAINMTVNRDGLTQDEILLVRRVGGSRRAVGLAVPRERSETPPSSRSDPRGVRTPPRWEDGKNGVSRFLAACHKGNLAAVAAYHEAVSARRFTGNRHNEKSREPGVLFPLPAALARGGGGAARASSRWEPLPLPIPHDIFPRFLVSSLCPVSPVSPASPVSPPVSPAPTRAPPLPQALRARPPRPRPLDASLAVWSRPQGWLELKSLLRDICPASERGLVEEIVAQTGLMLACRGRHAELVAFLLKEGAAVGQREPMKRASALHVAAEVGDGGTVAALLGCGADVSPRMCFGSPFGGSSTPFFSLPPPGGSLSFVCSGIRTRLSAASAKQTNKDIYIERE